MVTVAILTDEYALCDKCGGGNSPGNPIIRIGGAFADSVRLHRLCFDAVVDDARETFQLYWGQRP